MTDREAFKIGFLTKCAESGLTRAETEERIKQAHAMIKMGQWLGLEFLSGLPAAATKALMLAAIVPPVAGSVGGYMLAKSQNRPYSKEMARKDEELAEYYRAMDQLERARRHRDAAAA